MTEEEKKAFEARLLAMVSQKIGPILEDIGNRLDLIEAQIKEIKSLRKQSPASELTEDEIRASDLFRKLKETRLSIASRLDRKIYYIAADYVLIEFCRKLPKTRDEMLRIRGYGETRYEESGKEFLAVIEKGRAA